SSPANACGVSRKALRVNWSSTSTRASAPRAVALQSPRPPASASAMSGPNCVRISASNAGSLWNHSRRDTDPGRNQNARTVSGAAAGMRLMIRPDMRTSYRDIFLLACCQALLLANSSGLISLNGLAGYQLASDKSLATLGVTTYVLGSAAAAMPMALWMGRVGRRRGFIAGALENGAGGGIGVLAAPVPSFR